MTNKSWLFLFSSQMENLMASYSQLLKYQLLSVGELTFNWQVLKIRYIVISNELFHATKVDE